VSGGVRGTGQQPPGPNPRDIRYLQEKRR